MSSSKEQKECTVRILKALENKQLSARQLLAKCTKDDLASNYKGHSSATAYKALRRLLRYNAVVAKGRHKGGRGRPYTLYMLNLTTRGKTEKNGEFCFGKNFANSMFKNNISKDSDRKTIFRVYKGNLLFLVEHLLADRKIMQLNNLPLTDKNEEKALKANIEQNIEVDCEEIKEFSKKFIELIFEQIKSQVS